MDENLTLIIKRTSRCKQGKDTQSYWQEFHISIPKQAYVLDALEAAWSQDKTLMFRHSCHHASCGSCGLRIQGRESLACITHAFEAAQGGVLWLEPLRNFPVLADLVVDMSGLAQKLEDVGARVLIQALSGQMQFVNCIECGLCVSACPVAATSEHYLGPAALVASATNMVSPNIRARVEGDYGVWRCHTAFECTEVCPAGVDPAMTIMGLRKTLLLSIFNMKGH